MNKKTLIVISALLSSFLNSQTVFAHCDTMEGPVVKDAKKAFEANNVNHVLKWVKAENDNEVKSAFNLAMKVRPLNADARQLAENYFYNVLVRIHRAGEGAPFTGIQPSGMPIDERVKTADKSIETGNFKPLESIIPKDRVPELKKRFNKAMAMKNYDVDNVQAGREYIESYVQFFKYAEGEEGHAHGHAAKGEDLHLIMLSLIILSGVLLITTVIFGVRCFNAKKV